MRFAAVFLLLLGSAATAAPDSNTLTVTEAADGWLLLFDGTTTFGWQVDGEARVQDGALVLGGTRATTARTTTAFQNGFCSFSMEMRWDGTQPPGFNVPDVLAGNLLDSAKDKFVVQYIKHLKPPVQVPPPGCAPWSFTVPAGSRLYLRNVKVRPEKLQPIFNGNDLAGWKVLPGHASKFTAGGGVLGVRGGKGDLQSEGKWADFVLQLECKVNGERLNSGVFFRCLPDQYQMGYEAQIHNAFNDQPSKEYAVEEYDPRSHQLIGKRLSKYQAIDYGTGAIYRRIPARRPVAKDFEWFTMTVLARGRHVAVWVDGVHVTDWTDNRPAADNARKGFYGKAGPISLQGHDPGTDLSFRNFRIAELPADK
jgi:hypothetical protein